jgi:hypothetical protein
MPVTNGPNLHKMINALTGDPFANDFRSFLQMIDVLVQCAVISKTLSAPPGSPTNGDRYIVGPSPSGAWAGQAGKITVWTTDDPAFPSGFWQYYTPNAGWLVYNVADTTFYSYSGSAWAALAAGGSSTLAGDTDVVISSPANNDVLTYETSSTKWKNKPATGGSGTLAGDTDVVISSPANNDVLTYETSSTKWKNKPAAGGGGSANVDGDTHPGSPAAIDDEFEGGSLSGSWTQLASPSITISKGSAVFTHTGTGADVYQAIVKATPSTPYTVGAKIVWATLTQGGAAGMMLRESSSGKMIILMIQSGNVIVQWRTSSAFNSNRFTISILGSPVVDGLPKYFAIGDDGTNLSYQVSWDGISFITLASEGRTAWMTPDQIGVFLDQFTNAETTELDVDWFRQLA